MKLSYHHVIITYHHIIMTSHRRHCVRDHRLPDSLFDCYWELPLACVLNDKEWDCTGGHNGCHGHEIESYANNYLDVIYITSKRHPGTLPIFLMNPLSKWDKYICAQCALHIMIYKFSCIYIIYWRYISNKTDMTSLVSRNIRRIWRNRSISLAYNTARYILYNCRYH